MYELSVHPELEQHIRETPLADTHEHQCTEARWVQYGARDVLSDLLSTYVPTDFHGAHCDADALKRAYNNPDLDQRERWESIAEVWPFIQHTGYAEAMDIHAKEIYGIDEITGDALIAAQPIFDSLHKPGERYRLLSEVANLDHVQIDGDSPLPADPAGPEFFLHDISWFAHCAGTPDLKSLAKDVGVEVRDLASYRRALEAVFAKYGAAAVAVKAQHAYVRTLRWEKREDGAAERVLTGVLRGEELSEADRLCLGDWAWARGVELSTEYGLPFKLHTGFYAGADNMLVDRIRAGHLGPIAMAYPNAKFVCMHMAYPYGNELIAMAKQFRNIYVDMCWGWAINPYAGVEFVRTYIRAAAANKLFAFGGDTAHATGTVAYAAQARKWLGRALSMELRDGFLTLEEAKYLATRVMIENQRDCFPIERARATLATSVAA